MLIKSPDLPTALKIEADGEHVVMTIADERIRMTVEGTLLLSRRMREEAAFAKSRGKQRAKMLRSAGVLRDASAPAPKPLPYLGQAIHCKEPVREWRTDDVTTEGRRVLVCVTRDEWKGFHYENAFTVAQWLRVRAKEAAQTRGDMRHWSEI